MNRTHLLAPLLVVSLAVSFTAAARSASLATTPLGPRQETVQSTTDATRRVLEVSVNAVTSKDADALDKATASAIAQRDAAITQAGCIHSTVTAIAADARGSSPAVVCATVWKTIEDAESASLAADTGTPTANNNSYFRLLRDAKIREGATGHVEVVIFRTKPGVTREANLALFDKGEAHYVELGKGDGGLLGHSLWLSPDGRWVHLLFWRSEADYQRTGKALFGKPAVGGWIRSLDFKRFTVYRGDIAGAAKRDAAPQNESATTK